MTVLQKKLALWFIAADLQGDINNTSKLSSKITSVIFYKHSSFKSNIKKHLKIYHRLYITIIDQFVIQSQGG